MAHTMKFYRGVQGGKRNRWLEFCSDPDTHLVCKKDFTKFMKICSRQGAAILYGDVMVIQE